MRKQYSQSESIILRKQGRLRYWISGVSRMTKNMIIEYTQK